MAKNAPCFAHSGWYQDLTPMTLPAPASTYSATQTPFIAGPLAARMDSDVVRQLI